MPHGPRKVTRLPGIGHDHVQPCQVQRLCAAPLKPASGLQHHQRCALVRQQRQQFANALGIVGQAHGGRTCRQRYFQAVLGHIDAHEQWFYGFVCHRPSLQKYEVNARPRERSTASEQLFGLCDKTVGCPRHVLSHGMHQAPRGQSGCGQLSETMS